MSTHILYPVVLGGETPPSFAVDVAWRSGRVRIAARTAVLTGLAATLRSGCVQQTRTRPSYPAEGSGREPSSCSSRHLGPPLRTTPRLAARDVSNGCSPQHLAIFIVRSGGRRTLDIHLHWRGRASPYATSQRKVF